MIKGVWHPQGVSERYAAKLIVTELHYQLLVDEEVRVKGRVGDLRVSDRIGRVARSIEFEDGSVFESSENDAIDTAFALSGNHSFVKNFIDRLENNLMAVFVGVLVTLGFVSSMVTWGIPAAGEVVAKQLPGSFYKRIGQETLSFIDAHLLEPSTLPLARQREISAHFETNVLPIALMQNQRKTAGMDDFEFKLHFRSWRDGNFEISNAMALPSGDLVLTDRLIKVAQEQQEIDIVLLHEIGHVLHRHSVEEISKGAIMTLLLTLFVGDSLSFVGDLGVGIGSFFVNSYYSRKNELEADSFAYQNALKMDISPDYLPKILLKMSEDFNKQRCESLGKSQVDFSMQSCIKTMGESNSKTGYWATHPSHDIREKSSARFQACYEADDKWCH